MAAPNTSELRGPDRGGEAPTELAKLDVVRELAARLAAIEAGPEAGSGSSATRSSDTATATTAPVAATTGPGVSGPERVRGNGSATAIGSSGTEGPSHPARRRRGEPGGHPEDDLGDPEAVAKAICLRLLTGSSKPRAGLATALKLRGIPDDVAGRVLDRFTEVGLINDQAYAEAFVAVKHRERALGPTALRTELRRKGVDDDIVAAAVGSVDPDMERDRAGALIARRVDAAMAHGEPAARRRLIGLLARRGHSAELAHQVVDQAVTAYLDEQHRDEAG
ncbi:regulatory protein RecX [Nakamurella sp. GG22]